MENEARECYYDVSYQKTKDGPVGSLRRTELQSVAEWMKENEGRLQFVIIMQMPGSPEGLPDREV